MVLLNRDAETNKHAILFITFSLYKSYFIEKGAKLPPTISYFAKHSYPYRRPPLLLLPPPERLLPPPKEPERLLPPLLLEGA